MEYQLREQMTKEELESQYRVITGREIDMSADDDKSIIPKNFALQHYRPRNPDPMTAKYLRYVIDDENVDGFLQFSGDKLLSPYSKLEAEVSKNDGRFVHIRCSYNNKYWLRPSPDSNFIVATGTHEEEDTSKWSCTLFEPIYDAEHKGYRFRHVQLGYELYRASIFDKFPDGLLAKEKAATIYEWKDSVFATVVDWDALYIFPKHVTLKGHNGKYLRFIGRFLQFSGTDLQHPSLIHEIFPEHDGSIRIKNAAAKRFWIHDPNWIIAVSSEGREYPRTLFHPVKLDNNVVALRSLGNDHFCTGISVDGKTDCLNADLRNPDKQARMEVSEAVISRRIENIEYRIKDAKIYGDRVWSMAKGDAVNRTKAADSVQFTFSFEDKRKKNWSNTIANKYSVSHTFNAGVPMIGNGQVKVLFEGGGGYSWGETHKEKMQMSYTNTVTIPPMSRVKMNAVVKRGFVDVPFSYTQIDTLRDGTQVSHEYDDGVFNGVHSYDFEFKSDKLPLPVSA